MDPLGLIHIRLCSSISPPRGMSQSNSATPLTRQRSRQAEEGHDVGVLAVIVRGDVLVLLEPSKASLNGVARTERSAAKD